MTNTSTPTPALPEALREKFYKACREGEISTADGADWLWAELLAGAPEFDFSAYEDEPYIGTTHAYELTTREIWEGKREAARWQHDQLAARIGAEKFHADVLKVQHDRLAAENERLEAQEKEVLAQLARMGNKIISLRAQQAEGALEEALDHSCQQGDWDTTRARATLAKLRGTK